MGKLGYAELAFGCGVLGIYNASYKYLFPIEPTEKAVAASGDGIMLNSLSQF